MGSSGVWEDDAMLDPGHPLHLVLGEPAACGLAAAIAAGSLPGAVFAVLEDPSHGPLDRGDARKAFLERLDRDRPDAIVVWSGDNASEATFLRMAAAWLDGRREVLLRVTAPARDGRPYVAVHAPEELARLHPTRMLLDEDARRALARDFARLRDDAAPVRRWEEGRIVGVLVDAYDRLLLDACGPDWRPAARVVGTAIAACDGPNAMSDVFFWARLDVLREAGRVEVEGPSSRRDRPVRLAGAGARDR